jgi:hypothetical protein
VDYRNIQHKLLGLLRTFVNDACSHQQLLTEVNPVCYLKNVYSVWFEHRSSADMNRRGHGGSFYFLVCSIHFE